LALGPTQPFAQLVQGSFPEVKRPGLDFDHGPPSGGKVKNEWSYNFTSPLVPSRNLKERVLYFNINL